MEAFIRRLKERKLVQWALAYGVAAAGLVQLLDIVANRFHWPEPVMRWGILALLLGFAVTLVLAWFHGDRGQQRVSAMELCIFTALLVAAVVGVAALRPGGAPRAEAASGDALLAKTVAVLPFRSLSDSSSNANFADGIHDELLTQLSRIADLQVISRVSVMQYRNTTKPLRQIARELGAGSILTGSVQRAGGQVRIEAELVDARTDKHLWAETYTRSAADVFTVETDVAQGITQALHAALTAREQASLSAAAHTTPEVYDLYLRARESLNIESLENAENAERLLERAVQIDSAFADAWGTLALAYQLHSEATPEYMPGYSGVQGASKALEERARRTAEHALRLQRDVADARVVLGWDLIHTRRDAAAALREFELARRASPSNAEAWNGVAYALQMLGRWNEALAASRKAASLAPRGGFNVLLLARTYAVLWRYGEAIQTLNDWIARAPENAGYSPMIASYRFEQDGDTARLRRALQAIPDRDSGPETRFAPSGRTTDPAADLRNVAHFPDMILTLGTEAPKVILRAYLYTAAGNTAAGAAAYDTARMILERGIRERPDEPRLRTALAWAYGGLRRQDDAIREARRAVELCPESRNAIQGPTFVRELAAAYSNSAATPTQRDSAFRLLDHLVRVPYGVTRMELRFNDNWDTLRADPRFARLVAVADSVQRGH